MIDIKLKNSHTEKTQTYFKEIINDLNLLEKNYVEQRSH